MSGPINDLPVRKIKEEYEKITGKLLRDMSIYKRTNDIDEILKTQTWASSMNQGRNNMTFQELIELVRGEVDDIEPSPYAVVVTQAQLVTLKAIAKPIEPKGNDAFARVWGTPVYATKKKLNEPKLVYSREELEEWL